MLVVAFWVMVLTALAMIWILCDYPLRTMCSLVTNHFPWFIVLVPIAYIIVTHDWTSAKQEQRRNTMRDSTPAKHDLQHNIFRFPAFVREEPQRKTLDEIMIEIQSKEWESFVEETRQANLGSFTRDGNGW
jgi:hypothetical protein